MGTVLTGNHEEYGWNGRAGDTALTGKELCHGVFGAVAGRKNRNLMTEICRLKRPELKLQSFF